ncbi:Ctype lysozyme/alpha-lactalbumin superfamily protein [Pelomyxa schiedti]|nr:Ctype lysozyme/alpha-lactalbumin superfamily protein [Pelomyxa schiedti]
MKVIVLFVLVLAFVASTYAATCNPNPCGSAAYTDVPTACKKYTTWNQANCQCIANHESSGNYHACNNNTNGSLDIGLWQINDGNWASCSGGSAPCTVDTNLKCAELVYQWGSYTWKYWSTCSTCGCCNSA